MKAFFKLIRWPNLLIVMLTMGLMRYAIIEPVLSKINFQSYNLGKTTLTMSLQSGWLDFFFLVLATVLITAGGYVINDYFDIKTDLINRGKVIVGTTVPRRQAMMWHNILNLVGVAAGFYVSARTGYIWMGFLFLVVSGLLYFYSASYKRQFLIGNIIVAILTGMVPLLVILFEAPRLYQFYAVNAVRIPDLNILFYWVGGFALFAFITTLCRELIKDIEDFEGDVAYGRNTVPVVIGIVTSKIVSICLIIITLVLLYSIWYLHLHDFITLIYMSVAIALPLLFVIYQVIVSKSRKQLHSASRVMKIVMISGILYSIIVKIILTYNILIV
jgi:4-hydroxybenzoate polyprenyltransferase